MGTQVQYGSESTTGRSIMPGFDHRPAPVNVDLKCCITTIVSIVGTVRIPCDGFEGYVQCMPYTLPSE